MCYGQPLIIIQIFKFSQFVSEGQVIFGGWILKLKNLNFHILCSLERKYNLTFNYVLEVNDDNRGKKVGSILEFLVSLHQYFNWQVCLSIFHSSIMLSNMSSQQKMALSVLFFVEWTIYIRSQSTQMGRGKDCT